MKLPTRIMLGVLVVAPVFLNLSSSAEQASSLQSTKVHVRILDDLVSSGLELTGMRNEPPSVADPENPTPEELRRLALYTNYRGLLDVTEGSGFGERFGLLQPVPGIETNDC